MFNYFDVIVGLLVLAGGYFGFRTGIAASVFYIASGFAGMWAAETYAPEPGLKFYLVFLLGAAVCILAGFIAGKLLKAFLLGPADRGIGLVLGLVLGLAVASTVVIPFTHHLPRTVQKAAFSSYSGSRVVPYFQKLYPAIKHFNFEKELRDALPSVDLPKVELPENVSKSIKDKLPTIKIEPPKK